MKSFIAMERLYFGDGLFVVATNVGAEPDVTNEFSIPRVIALTFDSNAYMHSKANPNICIADCAILLECDEPNLDINNFKVFNSDDNNFMDPFATKRKKKVERRKKERVTSL